MQNNVISIKLVRNVTLAFASVFMVILFVMYWWAPNFVRESNQSNATSTTLNFVTEVTALTGTIVSVQGSSFRLALSNPPPLIEEHLHERTIFISEATKIQQAQRKDLALYQQEMDDFQRRLAQSVPQARATSSVADPGVQEGIENPLVSGEYMVSSTVAVATSTDISAPVLESPIFPEPFVYMDIGSDALVAGTVVAVMAETPIFYSAEIQATRIVISSQ